ncbi:MAG: amidohydrolase family protein, partial [Bdellovibrionales bacterium]|nr:amidohydrolase family protein [Bdellovibrionales bacterium]
MTKKVIEGQFSTSQYIGPGRITFDQNSGLIEKFEKNVTFHKQGDYYEEDKLIFAGMGDVHIHAREDVSGQHTYKEDFVSASEAAINGGLVHACDMPNNPVAPIDDESYLQKLKLTDKAKVSLLIYAGIGPNTKPLSFKVPYKAYMGPSVGDLFFENNQQLEETLKHYEGQWVSFHCEDPEILENSKNKPTHLERRPVEAEVLATKEALKLIKQYNLYGKLCHYSSGEGLKLIQKAKEQGLPVTCEATPQHLYFSDDQVGLDRFYQMNPPIRKEDDHNALLQAFLKGEIDYLATDHAPHTQEEKEKGTSGLTGLDTYGAFVTWLLLEKKMDPKLIALTCCENPGTFVNQFIEDVSVHASRFKKY